MQEFALYVEELYNAMLAENNTRETRTERAQIEKKYQLFIRTLPWFTEPVRRPADYSPDDGPPDHPVGRTKTKSMTKSVDKRNKKNGGEGRKTGIRRVCWTFRASIAEDPSVEAQAEELCAKLADT